MKLKDLFEKQNVIEGDVIINAGLSEYAKL